LKFQIDYVFFQIIKFSIQQYFIYVYRDDEKNAIQTKIWKYKMILETYYIVINTIWAYEQIKKKKIKASSNLYITIINKREIN
jgi:hypothetical protein